MFSLPQDLSAARTPHGGIRTKKTKQEKKEELYNKKRSRKSLNKQLLSMDFGFLGPPDSDSSEEEAEQGLLLFRLNCDELVFNECCI